MLMPCSTSQANGLIAFAFANLDIYTFLEEEDCLYAIRLPANQNLQRAIEHLLARPVGWRSG